MWKPIENDANGNHAKPLPNSVPLEKAEKMAILAERLFGYYHEQELAADVKSFLTAVVKLFCLYPHEIVYAATSELGLVTRHKFPPRLSEIKEYLDERMAPIWREEERRRNLLPRDPELLPAPAPKTKRYSYGEFLAMAERGEVKPRPVGRFEVEK